MSERKRSSRSGSALRKNGGAIERDQNYNSIVNKERLDFKEKLSRLRMKINRPEDTDTTNRSYSPSDREGQNARSAMVLPPTQVDFSRGESSSFLNKR